MKKILIVCILVVVIIDSVFSIVGADGAKITLENSIQGIPKSLSNLYGGCPEIKLTNGTGFFSIINISGTWWFVTPDGYAFYSTGVCAVSPTFRYVYNQTILEKYNGSYTAWANATVDRFKEWGFNTLGAWSTYDLFNESKIPYTHTFIFRHEGNVEWRKRVKDHPDVFDDSWRQLVKNEVQNVTMKLRNDSYLIGYWLDNEMHWGPDSFDKNTLLETYMSVPYTCPGKKKVVAFLQERYNGSVDEFNTVWNMHVKSFDELYDQLALGKQGMNVQGRAKDDVTAFSQLVAQTYFEFMNNTIRAYDPHHLILGVRFHWEGAPAEVIEECGKYCDVISINYYRFRLAFYDLIKHVQSHLYGSILLDQWMLKYYQIGKKPILASEFSYAAVDSGLRWYPFYGPSKYVLTQKQRGKCYTWYAQHCAEAPYVIGYHWFSYIDKVDDTGLDMNCGLVNTYDTAYGFVTMLNQINSKVYEIHSKSVSLKHIEIVFNS